MRVMQNLHRASLRARAHRLRQVTILAIKKQCELMNRDEPVIHNKNFQFLKSIGGHDAPTGAKFNRLIFF